MQAKLDAAVEGGSQVTFGGKPLYTFVQDSPGQVTGNGVTDSFGGTSFTWTVASTGQVSSTEHHDALERQQLRRLERRLRLLAAAEASATARLTNSTISSVGAPGVNTSATPSFLSSGMSSAGIVPPTVTTTSLGALIREQLHHPRDQRHVCAGEDREPDGVGVLLDRGLGDLLRRLVQARCRSPPCPRRAARAR